MNALRLRLLAGPSTAQPTKFPGVQHGPNGLSGAAYDSNAGPTAGRPSNGPVKAVTELFPGCWLTGLQSRYIHLQGQDGCPDGPEPDGHPIEPQMTVNAKQTPL